MSISESDCRVPEVGELIAEDVLAKAAGCLKTMGHPVRLRIVDILMHGEYSVRDVAAICAMRENQVCEHMRLMQACGLLTSERRGRAVYYTVASPQLPSLLKCIKESCGAGGG
jgi:ArsR family transcriptional regulator, zinc-responsive transcriptional repressor